MTHELHGNPPGAEPGGGLHPETPPRGAPRRRPDLRLGILLVTAGIVTIAATAYLVWFDDVSAANSQDRLSGAFAERLTAPTTSRNLIEEPKSVGLM